MPAVVTSIKREGQFVLLRLALPGRPVHDVGALLLDPASGRLHLRLREHWDDLADAEDAEYLAALDQDFRRKIDEIGGQRFLESLEDSLSNILLLTDREAVPVDSFSRVADQLFEKHVEPIPVEPFRTHLPLYTLRAAAGKFGADEAVDKEGWVRVPEHLRLTPKMFVAHVEGRSMEPRIPDGSLNIFRAPVVGSRKGKIVLVQLLDLDEKFTVKRYTSKTRHPNKDEDWEHESIRLEPLNPEFEPLDLAPDRLKVIAEWIQTLE